MAVFDLIKVNRGLVKAIQLCVACRVLLNGNNLERSNILDIEREIREAAAECQKHIDGKTSGVPEPSRN